MEINFLKLYGLDYLRIKKKKKKIHTLGSVINVYVTE